MTITTIDAVVTDVVFVTELHGLLSFQISICQIRRTRNLRVGIACHTRQNDRYGNACLSNIICSAMKYLCHLVMSETLKVIVRPHPACLQDEGTASRNYFYFYLRTANQLLILIFAKSRKFRKYVIQDTSNSKKYDFSPALCKFSLNKFR